MKITILDTAGSPKEIELPERGDSGDPTSVPINQCNYSLTGFSKGDYYIKGPGWVDGDNGDGENLGYTYNCNTNYNPLTHKLLLRSIRVYPSNGRVTTHGYSSDAWGHPISPEPALLPDEGADSNDTRNGSYEIIGNYTIALTNLYSSYRVYADTGYVGYPWRMVWNGWKVTVRYKFVPIDYQIPECAPGTVYDENFGFCIPKPGYVWSGELNQYVPQYPLPEYDTPGINLPPTLPPITVGDVNICPECYTYNETLNVCEYTGGEDCLPVNCIPIGGCEIPLMEELVPDNPIELPDVILNSVPNISLLPDDINDILPPGHVESGTLEGLSEHQDPTTGDCNILNNCEDN